MLWQSLIYLYFFYVLNVSSIRTVRVSSDSPLFQLRELMKLEESLQGYIVLSEDAHQVRFWCDNMYI